MTGRHRTCLLLSSITFFSFIGLWPADDHSQLLAEDMLRTARESVRTAMQSFLLSYEDERNAVERGLGTKLERLQVILDNFHYKKSSAFRNAAVEKPSDLQLVHGRGPTQNIDICESLAGKRITMIGGEHIYRLHVLLLQHRERAEGKPFPCNYHEFCTHHHICLPDQHFQADILPSRYVKPPTAQELIGTESAAINYIVSDTLYSTRNESSREYMLPFIDPITGIRLRETFWLAAARKANVVVLGRGPLGAPGQTYAGNWSVLYHVPDYMDKSRAAFTGTSNGVRADQIAPRSLDILNAAVHLTISRFLPEVFQLLRSIARDIHPNRQKRLIWPSSWYRFPGRGVARTALLHALLHSKVQGMLRYSPNRLRLPWSSADHVLTLQLSVLIDSDVTNTTHLEDPWTLLFNAQVYLQNMVLRELLPRHGIVFLPLDVPWLEDDLAHRSRYAYMHRTAKDVDLERTAVVGEAFLARMDYVLKYLE